MLFPRPTKKPDGRVSTAASQPPHPIRAAASTVIMGGPEPPASPSGPASCHRETDRAGIADAWSSEPWWQGVLVYARIRFVDDEADAEELSVRGVNGPGGAPVEPGRGSFVLFSTDKSTCWPGSRATGRRKYVDVRMGRSSRRIDAGGGAHAACRGRSGSRGGRWRSFPDDRCLRRHRDTAGALRRPRRPGAAGRAARPRGGRRTHRLRGGRRR